MRFRIVLLALYFIFCGFEKTCAQRSSLSDYEFKIAPRIINKKENSVYKKKYFVEYQFAKKTGAPPVYLTTVDYKTTGDKLYIFFDIATSSQLDKGRNHQLQIQPLYSEFIEKDQVYWLNEDQSSVKLQIQPY